MKQINLTDIEIDIEGIDLDFLIRVDNFYFASQIGKKDQIVQLEKLGIKNAIDLKESSETKFKDSNEFENSPINYVHFPIKDLSIIDFGLLSKFSDLLNNLRGKTLIYCMSGNRVSAIFSLYLSLICGHPKRRCVDFALKTGLTNENAQKFLLNTLKCKKLEDCPNY